MTLKMICMTLKCVTHQHEHECQLDRENQTHHSIISKTHQREGERNFSPPRWFVLEMIKI